MNLSQSVYLSLPVYILLALCACGAGGGSSPTEPSSNDASTVEDAGLIIDSTVLDVSSPNEEGGVLHDADICVGVKSDAQPTPLNLMVMFDQSSSMKGNRWTSVVDALKGFTVAPEASGIRIALNYFALTKSCNSNQDCKSPWGECGSTGFCTFDDFCEASAYESPEVEFSELPGAAAAIAASLDAHAPLFNTPTPPALQGAITHAKAWTMAHLDEKVVVVLATDGEPDSITCGIGKKDIPLVVDIAKAGYEGSPSISTYVIGVGKNLGSLNGVAEAGGTKSAYMVDGTGGAGTQKQFVDAMNAIRGSALPCSYAIPEPSSGTLDYGKVNVLYTPSGGETETIGKVESMADCDEKGGWYYDNPSQPATMVVCPTTCVLFHASSGGSVEIQLGCKTVHQIK